jgi:hypothetical protein
VAPRAGKRFADAVEASQELETARTEDGGAPSWPADVIGCLEIIDRKLVALGEHPISEWWWAQLREFYGSERWLFVGRVGRRGGKSDTWAKVAIAEIVSGRFAIPLGDTGIVSIVSVDREEAANRVQTISAYCTALSIEHKPTAYAITFPGRPYAVEVKTASVRGVSGFTSILCIGDEVDKWKDEKTGANPADAVIASWTPTLATMLPHGARMALLSSPWLYEGPHSRAFDMGTTSERQAAHAATWTAHPAATPELCRRLQVKPDPLAFRREYEAIPTPEADADGITTEQLTRARRDYACEVTEKPLYVATLYPCPRTARWLLLVTTRRKGDDGDVRTAVAHAEQWPASTEPRVVLMAVREVLSKYEIAAAWMPDDAPSFAVKIAARLQLDDERQLVLLPVRVTDDMHASLRLRFLDDGVELPESAPLRLDLLSVKKRDEDGANKFEARGFAVCMALACHKTTVGPSARRLTHRLYSPEWWTAEMKREEKRDYARQTAINEARSDAGDDWIAEIRRGAEGGFVDAGEEEGTF